MHESILMKLNCVCFIMKLFFINLICVCSFMKLLLVNFMKSFKMKFDLKYFIMKLFLINHLNEYYSCIEPFAINYLNLCCDYL